MDFLLLFHGFSLINITILAFNALIYIDIISFTHFPISKYFTIFANYISIVLLDIHIFASK